MGGEVGGNPLGGHESGVRASQQQGGLDGEGEGLGDGGRQQQTGDNATPGFGQLPGGVTCHQAEKWQDRKRKPREEQLLRRYRPHPIRRFLSIFPKFFVCSVSSQAIASKKILVLFLAGFVLPIKADSWPTAG